MVLDTIECVSPSDYASKLKECEALASKDGDKPLFLLFYGEKNSFGKSWCPDCTAAEPVIEEALSAISTGCILLSCCVAREEYRSPEYPYRTDPNIKLQCVPTLIKWHNGKVQARLNDSQSQLIDLVRELVDA
jgi:hypothetical protein